VRFNLVVTLLQGGGCKTPGLWMDSPHAVAAVPDSFIVNRYNRRRAENLSPSLRSARDSMALDCPPGSAEPCCP